MYRRASDLNEFNKLCKTLVEMAPGFDGDRDSGGSMKDDVDTGDEVTPENGVDSSIEDYLGKVKAVIVSFQKVGARIEELIQDQSVPEDLRGYLINVDKEVSKVYMKLYKFAHRVKTKAFAGDVTITQP